MPILTFDQVTSVRVKRLDSYWHSKVTADGIPTRADMTRRNCAIFSLT